MQLSGKKVLVTGAAGFIGSHLTERLVAEGCQVTAFVRYNSKNDWGWLEQSKYLKEINVYSGDIRDFDSVSEAVKGVDMIFHLAALIGIPYSYHSPLAYLKTNVEGTYNILQAARNQGIERLLVTSTSETYGSAQYVPIDEKHPLVGQSPYSASKIGADQLAVSYHRSFNLPVAIIRPFNTFGPRQSARAIIPTIISQILNGETELKLGNLSPTRDLTYVKDTVAGFIEVIKSDSSIGEVINIGSNFEISIAELVALIAERIGAKITVGSEQERIRPENSEVDRLWCDNRKAEELCGWKPRYKLADGLDETIAWFKDQGAQNKAKLYHV